MELTPKELMKQYVDSQNFKSTTEIMQAMKDMFRDTLQQVMESELDAESGYEKSEIMSERARNIYGVEIPPEPVSKVSKIMPEVNEWQNRPLEDVYPFVLTDSIHCKAKEIHKYAINEAYAVLSITTEGQKNVPGIWIGELPSSRFWLNVLADMKSRKLKEVYLLCVNAISGFCEATEAVYPKAGIQRCIIHQIRYSTRFFNYKDINSLMADLKLVYIELSEDDAFNNLMQ